jgi:hypothetical protein
METAFQDRCSTHVGMDLVDQKWAARRAVQDREAQHRAVCR